MNEAEELAVQRAVEAALREDLADEGDITSDAVVPPDRRTRGLLVARERLVLAGLHVAEAVFAAVDDDLEFRSLARQGSWVEAGATFGSVVGSTRSILRAERTALNFLMRMCGIATVSRNAQEELEGTGTFVLDTRKTAPGLRLLDKQAVRIGGARNHRMGLFDAVMIKDTHLDSGCTIGEAVFRALEAGNPRERITVEVRTPEQVEEAISAGAGRVLLDNMDLSSLRRAVEIAGGRIVLEASGGLRPGRLREVAECGVDFVSLGWLTHSVVAVDLAMEMETLR